MPETNYTKPGNPPRWPDRFLSWFCHDDHLEILRGDVYELYEERIENMKKWKADLFFILDILGLCRPFAFKKRSRNSIGITSTYTYTRPGPLTTRTLRFPTSIFYRRQRPRGWILSPLRTTTRSKATPRCCRRSTGYGNSSRWAAPTMTKLDAYLNMSAY